MCSTITQLSLYNFNRWKFTRCRTLFHEENWFLLEKLYLVYFFYKIGGSTKNIDLYIMEGVKKNIDTLVYPPPLPPPHLSWGVDPPHIKNVDFFQTKRKKYLPYLVKHFLSKWFSIFLFIHPLFGSGFNEIFIKKEIKKKIRISYFYNMIRAEGWGQTCHCPL